MLVKKFNGRSDWDVIFAFLHEEGQFCQVLTKEQHWTAFCLGDGFGDLRAQQLFGDLTPDSNSGFDWSHVRDSSPQAIKRIADFIRAIPAAQSVIRVAKTK